MSNFLFGDPLDKEPTPATRAVKNLATPAEIGTGPDGKTCGDCVFLERHRHRGGYYLKCGKMRDYWTHGAGTDIRVKWAACSEFTEKENGK